MIRPILFAAVWALCAGAALRSQVLQSGILQSGVLRSGALPASSRAQGSVVPPERRSDDAQSAHDALPAANGAALPGAAPSAISPDARVVRGMTISCQSWGWEWGSDGFTVELDDLQKLGVNWVAIHPYASIRRDGTVVARDLDPNDPPEWITRPIREAHARGMSILIIPHIAYWGSPWKWRGEIDFTDEASFQRFFTTYQTWIANVARCAQGADGFSIGNELDKLVVHEKEWRSIITAVRAATTARLTYASDWTAYERVPFWDALDAVGVEAYFPLCESDDPDEVALRAGWKRVFESLERVHTKTGKPIVFTELGYNRSIDAARKPWAYEQTRGEKRDAAEALQTRCLKVALEEIGARREWLRGAFLWKWFVGRADRENFLMKAPLVRAAIASVWSHS